MINKSKENKIRKDERKKVWLKICETIPIGDLPGVGNERLSIRNGMVMAADIVEEMGIE